MTQTDSTEPQGPGDPQWVWSDDEGPPRPRRSRFVLLVVAAATPAILTAAALLRSAPAPSLPPDVATSAEPGLASPSPQPLPGPEQGLAIGEPPPPPEGELAPPTSDGLDDAWTGLADALPGPPHVAAMAAVVARSFLSAIGPRLDGGPEPATGSAYLEHVAVEVVDFPAPGFAVATVLGVVLDAEDGAYTHARVVRVAVPLRFAADGARLAGAPWWLPAPQLTEDRPTWEEVDDPSLAVEAGAALRAAGYREVDVTLLARTAGWPWLAVVDAVAPGEATPSRHEVWLRPHLGSFAVAGWGLGSPAVATSPAQEPEGVEP